MAWSNANTISSSPTPVLISSCGSFHSEVTQTCPIPLAENQIALEITDISNGISSAPDGTIIFSLTGIYMVEITLQLTHTNPLTANGDVSAWIKLFGSNVSQTTRQMTIYTDTTRAVLSLSYIIDLRIFRLPLDLTIFWTSTSSDVVLNASSNSGFDSGTPSVICNVFQIS